MARVKFEGDERIIIGQDIPYWCIDYTKHRVKLKQLTLVEAVVSGNIIWNLVKSGRVDVYGFDSVKEADSDKVSFVNILLALKEITSLHFPEEYETMCGNMVKQGEVGVDLASMLSNCYIKIGNALMQDYELKIVQR